MATSGVVTYRTTRDQIIKGALRVLNAYDPENSAGPTTNQVTNAAEALNLLVKKWEAVGLELWERKWGVVFPRINQGVYVLGSPGPAGDARHQRVSQGNLMAGEALFHPRWLAL